MSCISCSEDEPDLPIGLEKKKRKNVKKVDGSYAKLH